MSIFYVEVRHTRAKPIDGKPDRRHHGMLVDAPDHRVAKELALRHPLIQGDQIDDCKVVPIRFPLYQGMQELFHWTDD